MQSNVNIYSMIKKKKEKNCKEQKALSQTVQISKDTKVEVIGHKAQCYIWWRVMIWPYFTATGQNK